MMIVILAAIYGTLVGGEFVNAPRMVDVDGAWRGSAFISEPQANALGFKLLVDTPPACASNEYAVATGYADGPRITRTYETRTILPTPRRWTPLAIKRAASTLGRWSEVKASLVAADAYDDFCMAQYEAEDDPQFVALMTALRAEKGDAWVDEILNGAEVEP